MPHLSPGNADSTLATQRLLRQTFLTVAALATVGVGRFAARVAAERAAGPEGLAFLTGAFAVATLATLFGAAGMSVGTTKLVSQLHGEGRVRAARALARFAALAASAITVVAALVAATYAGTTEAIGGGRLAVFLVAVLTLAYGLYLIGKAVAYGEGRVRLYLLLEVVGFVLLVAGIGALFLSDSPHATVIPLIAAATPVALLAVARMGGRYGVAGLPLRPFGGYAIVGSVGALVGVGFTYATPLAAAYVTGIIGVATVGAVLAILEPLYLAPRALSLVLLPELSAEATKDPRAGVRQFESATRLSAVASLPICALLVVERDRVLQLFFSDEIRGGMTLAWFAAAFFVSVAGVPAITALAARGVREASLSMWSGIVGFGVAAAVWVGASSALGLAAVGLGYLVGSMAQVTVPFLRASQLYRPEWGSFWGRVTAAWAATIGVALISPRLWLDGSLLVAVAILMFPEVGMVWRTTAVHRSASRTQPQ